MENDPNLITITPTGPETHVEIKKLPHMGLIFFRALLISPFRPNTLADNAVVPRTRVVFQNFQPDQALIRKYRSVCGFSNNNPGMIPITYLQTLFIGLLGEFITSSFFPLNPMGLIQVFQSLEQKRPVEMNEHLDLACILSGFTKKETGVETRFLLEVRSGEELVWKGDSLFFTRSGVKKTASPKKPDEIFLEKKETIPVPSGTGRCYAAVSGDYNPHHLHTLPAKLLGFKKAIAHGMWSLARVAASLDREFDLHNGPASIQASFKLPIFMPAVTTLGWEQTEDEKTGRAIIHFELRDQQKGLPHLKGSLLFN
jgi:acyl dehydratase